NEYSFDEEYIEGPSNTSTYKEDYDERYKYAKLEISGGASQFEIRSTTDNLFEANLKETKNNYILKKTDYDSLVNLGFSSKSSKGFKFEDKAFGKVEIMLNAKPFWDIQLKMGAGEANFDFKDFKVKNVDLKGDA